MSDLTDVLCKAQLFYCEFGQPCCIYSEHDLDKCEVCLKDLIAYYREQLLRCRDEKNN